MKFLLFYKRMFYLVEQFFKTYVGEMNMRHLKNVKKHVVWRVLMNLFRRFPDGYNTYIEQGGSNVSGGQKQRLCIARALLKKPKVLILDDSTSAVDTATDASIQRSFEERIPDTTKIIISQRISSVQNAEPYYCA